MCIVFTLQSSKVVESSNGSNSSSSREQHKAFGPDLMESWNPVTRDLAVSTLKKQNLNVYSFFQGPENQ